jgi:endonuclease-3
MAKTAKTARPAPPKRPSALPKVTTGPATKGVAKRPAKAIVAAKAKSQPAPRSKRATAKRTSAPTDLKAQAKQVIRALAKAYPDAVCALTHKSAYQLLVATILSAQCTDERVNMVTPGLFAKYPDVRALAAADQGELEAMIRSTGFFRAKATSLRGMAKGVVEEFGGEIPRTLDELVTLPGVGRKTANVVLGHALGVPGFPVDRHVLRVSNRIGIAESDDPEVVEQQLCAAMAPERWTRASDTLILHGRRICKPKPLCDRCAVQEECDYLQHVTRLERPVGRAPKRKAPAPGRASSPNRRQTASRPVRK